MPLLVLALAPSIALFLIFYLRDKYDREPLGLLLKTFGLGILVLIPVGLIEAGIFAELGIDIMAPQKWWVTLLTMIFVVAVVEEAAKFFIVRAYAWHKPAFNEPYDGIMYALMASLGFATVENILYVVQWGATVAWLRALLTVPLHALTAVIMGYYIGLAKYTKDKKQRNRYLALGPTIAVLFHGIFNFFVASEMTFLVAMAPLLVLYAWILSLRASKMHAKRSPFKKVLSD